MGGDLFMRFPALAALKIWAKKQKVCRVKQDKQNKLAVEKIPKLLFSLAVPAICAQIVTLMYNIVDRIYIGRMEDGVLAMAAIGICAPIVMTVMAFAGLLGRGGSPLAAIKMGQNDREGAEKYLGHSFAMLIISSICITLFVLIFKRQILSIFAASPVTMPYAVQYISIYCLGTVFVQLTIGMNFYITTQGFAKTAMMTTMLGGVLNIILDPIFIFVLSLGIRGAAIATVISQFVSFVWVLTFLFGKKTLLRIKLKNMRIRWNVLKQILVLGSAPFFMSMSEGVLNICFNNQVRRFGGDVAVGAMTILFSVNQCAFLPVEGVAQGSQPIIGYNYGAGQYGRVKQTIGLAMTVTEIYTACFVGCMMFFPEAFIRVFNSDPQLIAMGKNMLRIYVAGMFTMGINSTCQQSYNSLGEGKYAFFFAFLRKAIALIPLLYILPEFLPWGVLAVVLAEPISDLITVTSNATYFRKFLARKLATPSGAPSTAGAENN